ncbi:hypothetical protein JTE90_018240 [Oedothorax gibbosus]|uniref:Endonuclease/exonuclease/phosphatase domain-containing protein n=1 Tax=Oedothorax gibbosus TaxID=931172 RepID=A0AAV6U8F6_9ARAC|nr:hypothetical protein JTE90_018240 [Oedothorax gibbosus]
MTLKPLATLPPPSSLSETNAKHPDWSTGTPNQAGNYIKDFALNNFFNIATPSTPTRIGWNSASTIDFGLIRDFNALYDINSIPDLSSDHNPIILEFFLNFSIPKLTTFHTNWELFNNSLTDAPNFLSNINSPADFDAAINNLNDAITSAHNSSFNIKDVRHSQRLSEKPLGHGSFPQMMESSNVLIAHAWLDLASPALMLPLFYSVCRILF